VAESANAEQYAAWNGENGLLWVASADQRDQVLAPVADALLAAATPLPGMRVLDLGCGCGVTSLRVAGDVGDAGSVTGVDISEPMLGVARDRAAAARTTNVSFVQADAQTYPFEAASFDLVISRFGTMFFSDLVAAFTNIAPALDGDGRLCVATWQPFTANEWLHAPIEVLLRHTEPLPPVEGPSMFAQSDPDAVTSTLRAAGFASIMIDFVDLDLPLGDTVDDALGYLVDTGVVRTLVASIPEGDARDAALTDVRATLEGHHDESGVKLGAGILLITATR
jgi:ubiquinone/menaquinone biosynthesis C-methylase UbiE